MNRHQLMYNNIYGWVFLVVWTHTVDCSNCSDKLITGPNGVPDDHLSATTAFSGFDAKFARLNSNKCWVSLNNNDDQFIQVDFDDTKIIHSIQTQGRPGYNQWSKTYTVSRSLDNVTWNVIRDDENNEVTFNGNTDRNTVVTNVLSKQTIANHLRIYPKTWADYPKTWAERQSLRLEVIGCTSPNTWKLHPIIVTNLTSSLWKKSASDTGTCSVFCHQEAACKSFVFNKDEQMCLAFTKEYLHGLRMDKVRGNTYFLRYASLDAYVTSLRERGYNETDNVIYKVFGVQMDSMSAKAVCKNDTTDLVNIRNKMTMAVLLRSIDNDYDAINNLFYVGGSKMNGKWMLNDDIEVAADLWAEGYPTGHSSKLCLILHKYGLQNALCTMNEAFICGF